MTDGPGADNPYRDSGAGPLLRIPVSTARRYMVLLNALKVAFPAGALALLAVVRFQIDFQRPTQVMTVVILVLLAALPFLIARGAHTWRIAGGRGEIRLFADRLEVPPARGHEAHVFPLKLLTMHKQEQVARVQLWMIPVGSIHRGYLITFSAPSVTRTLWDRVFADRRDVDRLFHEVDRVAHAGREDAKADGQPVTFQSIEEVFQAFDKAKRPAAASPPRAPTRTDEELEAQIDEELRKM